MASVIRSTWAKDAGGARHVTEASLPIQLHPDGVFAFAVTQSVPPSPTITFTLPLMGNGTKPYIRQIRLGHPVALIKNLFAGGNSVRIGDVLGDEKYLIPPGEGVLVVPIGYGVNIVEGEWLFVRLPPV